MTKSDEVILKVENLSKQYRLGLVGTGTLSHDLNRWWYRVRGKEDPYLKIGETNDRSQKGVSEYVWALKDINFEVKRGEVLGIIGKNGAGKSTLLKILSKVTSPTTGSVKTRGRIASLLEVGTGFHGEMTGRENIYLNGAILGMTKKEIASKIDEIIDFSGCARYIDTPVKRYSSGMTVRLAFAVAAFLDPDILIVDEVLAVGDAEFQKKAIGKMQDISSGEGRTVLFVSHNMAAVKRLCSKGILLENGNIKFSGSINDSIDNYINVENRRDFSLRDRIDRIGDNSIFKFVELSIYNDADEESLHFFSGEKLRFRIKYEGQQEFLSQVLATVIITDKYDNIITFWATDELGFSLDQNRDYFDLIIPRLMLRPGTYYVKLYSAVPGLPQGNLECDIVGNVSTIIILETNYWGFKKIRPNCSILMDGSYV